MCQKMRQAWPGRGGGGERGLISPQGCFRWRKKSAHSWQITRVGICADVLDGEGATPLHHAAAKGRVRTVRWLLRSGGADPLARDKRGRTPADDAAEEGHQEVGQRATNCVIQRPFSDLFLAAFSSKASSRKEELQGILLAFSSRAGAGLRVGGGPQGVDEGGALPLQQ